MQMKMIFANRDRLMDGNEYGAVMLYSGGESKRSEAEEEDAEWCREALACRTYCVSKSPIICPSCHPNTQDNLPCIPGRNRRTTSQLQLRKRNSRDAPTTKDQETPLKSQQNRA